MVYLLIIMIIFEISLMAFAIIKTALAINKMPKNKSKKTLAMENRDIFGVENTGCSLDKRELYFFTDEELGL